MSDLQLGLIVVGILAVAGVLVYNRIQEGAARRAAERAFGSRHADALLGEPAARREPVLEAAVPAGALPDAQLDYLVELSFARQVPVAEALELWRPLEHRFARRALLAGFDGRAWTHLGPAHAGRIVALRAGLQLVTRAGVASEAEVIEFRSGIESLAARLGASVAAPEIRQAMEAARSLDRVCTETDVQVALHVVGAPIDPGASLAGQPFQVSRRDDGLTFTLDVPRSPEPGRHYEAMVRAGRSLAASASARLVDDNGRELDERAFAAVAAELEAVRKTLAASGIEPGSPLALRLFS